MKRRLRRRVDLRTHVAARDRIDLAVEQAPFLQGDHVDFVEGAKALLRERRRRAQFAGAERRQRPPRLGDHSLDALETRFEGHGGAKTHALDGMTRQRRDPGRKLKHARHEAEAARGKIDCTRHLVLPSASPRASFAQRSSACRQFTASLPAAAGADQDWRSFTRAPAQWRRPRRRSLPRRDSSRTRSGYARRARR